MPGEIFYVNYTKQLELPTVLFREERGYFINVYAFRVHYITKKTYTVMPGCNRPRALQNRLPENIQSGMCGSDTCMVVASATNATPGMKIFNGKVNS